MSAIQHKQCEVSGPSCTGNALDIYDLPRPMCDECFAWLGMARVRPVTHWEHLRDAFWLFLRIVGRDFEGVWIGPGLAWSVCWGVTGGTRPQGEMSETPKLKRPSRRERLIANFQTIEVATKKQ